MYAARTFVELFKISAAFMYILYNIINIFHVSTMYTYDSLYVLDRAM